MKLACRVSSEAQSVFAILPYPSKHLKLGENECTDVYVDKNSKNEGERTRHKVTVKKKSSVLSWHVHFTHLQLMQAGAVNPPVRRDGNSRCAYFSP